MGVNKKYLGHETLTDVITFDYSKEKNSNIQIVGVQPKDGARIPGIRRWPKEYMPKIFDSSRVDRVIDISQELAEKTTLDLGIKEGIFAGISSGGSIAAALHISKEVENKDHIRNWQPPINGKGLLRELRFELCENTFHAYAFYNPPGNYTPIFCDSFHTNFGRKLAVKE